MGQQSYSVMSKWTENHRKTILKSILQCLMVPKSLLKAFLHKFKAKDDNAIRNGMYNSTSLSYHLRFSGMLIAQGQTDHQLLTAKHSTLNRFFKPYNSKMVYTSTIQ